MKQPRGSAVLYCSGSSEHNKYARLDGTPWCWHNRSTGALWQEAERSWMCTTEETRCAGTFAGCTGRATQAPSRGNAAVCLPALWCATLWCVVLLGSVRAVQAQAPVVVRGVVLENAATARIIVLHGEDDIDYAVVWDEQAVVRWLDGSPAGFADIQPEMVLEVTGILEHTPAGTVLRPSDVRIQGMPQGMPRTGATPLPGWAVPALLLLPLAVRLTQPGRTPGGSSELIIRQRKQRTWT